MPLDFSDIPKAPDELIDALENNRAIAIVGSGLSIAAGGPTWKELLLGIAAEAEDLAPNKILVIASAIEAIDNGRFLDAADVLRNVLVNNFRGSVIKQLQFKRNLILNKEAILRVRNQEKVHTLFKEKSEYQIRDLRPTISHNILMQLGFRAIITTNYDSLLEEAIIPSSQNIIVYSHSDPRAIDHLKSRNTTPFILKIHGDINYPNDIIITRQDYANLINLNSAYKALKDLFLDSHLFWIGYGHNDPDLDSLLDKLVLKFKKLNGGTALVSEDEILTIIRLRNAGIFPSEIPSYNYVPAYLKRLANNVDRQIIFTIRINIPLPENFDVDALRQCLVTELSKIDPTVRYLGAHPGCIELYFSSSIYDLQKLQQLINEDLNLSRIVRQVISEFVELKHDLEAEEIDQKSFTITLSIKKFDKGEIERVSEIDEAHIEKFEILEEESDIEFINRYDEIREIIKTLYAPYLIVSAPMGYGKTRLLEKAKSLLKEDCFCIHIELSRHKSYSIQSLASKILQKLGGLSFQSSELKDPFGLGGQVGVSIFQAVDSMPKRKVLLLIDEAEAFEDQVSKFFLDQFIPAIQNVLSNAAQPIPFRVLLFGRYISHWQQSTSKIPLTNLLLTPFDFDSVYQTAIEFNSQSNRKMGTDYVKQFASHLMHFTGGHPGCMANILRSSDFGFPIEFVISRGDIYYQHVVQLFIEAIERDIPHDLRDIFETLSAIRRFNIGLLRWLIDEKLIKWTKPVLDLEDQLQQTYLVNNDEGFLKDEITRRLLAIRLRRNKNDEFIKICEQAITFYDSRLAQKDCYRPDIVAIEILFQELQLSLCLRRSNMKKFNQKLKSILTRLSTFNEARYIITTLEERLVKDWEFKFNFSYLFPNYPFSKFISETSTFRKNLPGG